MLALAMVTAWILIGVSCFRTKSYEKKRRLLWAFMGFPFLWAGVHTGNQELQMMLGGFEEQRDYYAARDAGYDNKVDWDKAVKAEKKRKELERIARLEEEKKCRQDLGCWGDKHLLAASIECDDLIERLAVYQSEWTDGFFEPKFSHYKWIDKSKGRVSYFGDKIKFQTPTGAWMQASYRCDFDTESREVLDVEAAPGRL